MRDKGHSFWKAGGGGGGKLSAEEIKPALGLISKPSRNFTFANKIEAMHEKVARKRKS